MFWHLGLGDKCAHLAEVDEDGEDDHGDEEAADEDPDGAHLHQLPHQRLHLTKKNMRRRFLSEAALTSSSFFSSGLLRWRA